MVYFVGAGPGAADLITVRGMRCLERAEIVVYDRLVSQELLERVPLGAELHYVGKTPGSSRNNQQEINDLLVQLGKTGKTVVRLKGGDPYVFGRGWEEGEALREAGLDFEVVPGLSSALAAPALAGVPVTHRGLSRNFAVVTAQTAEGGPLQLDKLAALDTLVVLMGRSRLQEISERLLAAGKAPETPVACVERGTTGDQRVLRSRLDRLAEDADRFGLESPVTVVIGEVAGLDPAQGLPLQAVV